MSRDGDVALGRHQGVQTGSKAAFQARAGYSRCPGPGGRRGSLTPWSLRLGLLASSPGPGGAIASLPGRVYERSPPSIRPKWKNAVSAASPPPHRRRGKACPARFGLHRHDHEANRRHQDDHRITLALRSSKSCMGDPPLTLPRADASFPSSGTSAIPHSTPSVPPGINTRPALLPVMLITNCCAAASASTRWPVQLSLSRTSAGHTETRAEAQWVSRPRASPPRAPTSSGPHCTLNQVKLTTVKSAASY
jgi:hypothetical protein